MSQIICLELLISIVFIIVFNTIITIIITGPLVPLGLKPFPCCCFSTQPRIYSKFLEKTKALFKKIDSSLIHYILTTVSYPSIPTPPLLSLGPRFTPVPSPFRRKQASKRQQPNPAKRDTIRQGKNSSNRGWPRLPVR